MVENQSASLRPDTWTAGGLLDDVDVVLDSLEFCEWDYQGTIPQPVFALAVTMKPEDGGDDYTQYYSAGDLKNWVPSKDRKKAIQVGSTSGLNANCNAALFLTSLYNSGFPEEKASDSVDVFEGCRVHVNRVAQPKRAGLVRQQGTREATILLVTSLLSLPGEKARKKGSGKAKGQPRAAAAASPSNNLNEKALGVVMELIAEAGGEISKKDLSAAAFKKLASDPDRNKLVQMVYQDDFLGGDDAPWSYDGGIISLG